MRVVSLLLQVFWLFVATSVFAESELSFDFRKNMRHTGDVPEGYLWETGLRIPFAFSHSQSRMGVDNGNYIDLAAKLKSSLHYRHGVHDWSSSLFVGESYSMTPTIENRFIKSQDIFRIETRYLWNAIAWLSPYAHARFETSLFKSIDIDSIENDYEIHDADGTITERVKAKELHMADPFRPLYFQESIGVTAELLDKGYANGEARAGISARQTVANGQRVYVEEKDDVRRIRNLYSFFQIGPFVGTTFGGSLYKDQIEYTLGGDTLWPAWQSPKAKETFWKSLIIEANAGVAFKLNTWASLGYEYSAVRIPDIHHKFQQNHALTFNLSFDWAYTFGGPATMAETMTPAG